MGDARFEFQVLAGVVNCGGEVIVLSLVLLIREWGRGGGGVIFLSLRILRDVISQAPQALP